ncbi:nucleotidyltransferase domain-containing protein [Brasilonema octagenarum UFV-E1]|uniref:Nucleotidyltransferase domain-containing protein n=1 Tax=Brasilonema sennae CENA114 TaxID=415709 RepID=A0A856MI71_9CYAN|nr:nucleotidyltransferase domain-containing protein [Brasilonema sennae]QDL11055.1 nucleotidyltransferase domain-containing protein [Brasilonema sennae CENA114]QDL17399.1 nucleotidyltransferase domain-containing protein [Brasilonema octagenarum UFV-E1]
MSSHSNPLKDDHYLGALVDELCHVHNCHTVILYGSRAKGTHTAESDYDLFAVRETGESLHDARLWNNYYLDIFIYNEKDVIIVDSSFLRILGGVVLRECEGFGQRLLKRMDELFATGPAALSASEIQLRRTWFSKMLKRISQGNIEADYRRVWLLYALLEDYFALRQKWYLGSKESWNWLKIHDPQTYVAFEVALKSGACFSTIESLVEKVLAVNAA